MTVCEKPGGLPLVKGVKSEVKSVILNNAKTLASRADFKEFSIHMCLSDEGYKGEEAAQLWVWLGTTGLVVHLWKTLIGEEEIFHAYGRPEFLKGAPKPSGVKKATVSTHPSDLSKGKPDIKKMIEKKDVEELLKLLKHEDSSIRGSAVAALGVIGDSRAIEPLTVVFRMDFDWQIRRLADISLECIKEGKWKEQLIYEVNKMVKKQ